MLDVLAKFKDKNIIVKTILSYGKLDFKDAIIQKGRDIFGDKFEYLDTFLEPSEYAKYVSENNVLILNQHRQQGVGNSFAALNFGTKLFIRSEISTFKYFHSYGVEVFDTNSISKLNFDKFIFMDEQIRQNNIKNSAKFLSNEFLKEKWSKIFEGSTIEYWEQRAKNFGKHSVYNMSHGLDELESVDKKQEQIYTQVLSKYLKSKINTALDFGCGVGRFEPMLSKFADKVFAADPIFTLLNLAPKIDNVEYILLDIVDGGGGLTNLPDKCVDLIFVSLALGGIVDENQLSNSVAELKRVAKPNALFFIVENTAKQENQKHWHYRSVEFYANLFEPIKLKFETKYDDAGEEISIMVGV